MSYFWNTKTALLFFSHYVITDPLGPGGWQHSRLLCPPLSLGVCSDSCPLSWRYYPISNPLLPILLLPRSLLLGRKPMTNLDSLLKRDLTLLTNVHLVKAMAFPVVMYGCESWTIKKVEHWMNWWFWTVVLEKTLESPLDCKEIKPVHSKGSQSWTFIGRTDA